MRLSPDEEALFSRQLGRVVDYIDQLRSLDVDLAPGAAGEGVREGADLVAPGLDREAFLANAPRARDGFLLVPKVKGEA
jgi:aspartyl-tRNA(Asn)/glutamyl-tRNA(Gln) amidotransferase subunit C